MKKKEKHQRAPHYVSTVNPYAAKYLNRCTLCGREGFKSGLLDPGFPTTLQRKAIKKTLLRHYEELPLDEHGRCTVCARFTPVA